MIARKKKIIYISGPYANGGTELDNRKRNIECAKIFAIRVLNLGAAVICPHMNTAYLESDPNIDIKETEFLDNDLAILHYVDGIILLPNWKSSKGTKVEIDYATEIGVPVFDNIASLQQFLKRKIRCVCCGLFRLTYHKVYGGVFCTICYESIEKAVEFDRKEKREKYLLIPKLL